jgi:hypothetical protein
LPRWSLRSRRAGAEASGHVSPKGRHGSCESIEREKRDDLYRDIVRASQDTRLIYCPLGLQTVYVRFADHQTMTEAARRSRDLHGHRLCFLDHEAFDGADLEPGGIQHVCRVRRGRLYGPLGSHAEDPTIWP